MPEADRLTLYMRELVARWLTDNHASARDLAQRAKVTDTAISNLRRDQRGVGRDLLIALSQAMGYSLDDLVAEAERWKVGDPIRLPPRGERLVRPARYSNFELAAEVERRAGTSEEAIDLARADLKSAEDLTVDDWRSEIVAAKNRLRRLATAIPTGRSVDEARAAAEAAGSKAQLDGVVHAFEERKAKHEWKPAGTTVQRTTPPPPPLKPPKK